MIPRRPQSAAAAAPQRREQQRPPSAHMPTHVRQHSNVPTTTSTNSVDMQQQSRATASPPTTTTTAATGAAGNAPSVAYSVRSTDTAPTTLSHRPQPLYRHPQGSSHPKWVFRSDFSKCALRFAAEMHGHFSFYRPPRASTNGGSTAGSSATSATDSDDDRRSDDDRDGNGGAGGKPDQRQGSSGGGGRPQCQQRHRNRRRRPEHALALSAIDDFQYILRRGGDRARGEAGEGWCVSSPHPTGHASPSPQSNAQFPDGCWHVYWASVQTARALFKAQPPTGVATAMMTTTSNTIGSIASRGALMSQQQQPYRLGPDQIINHFPLQAELTRKDLMYKNIRQHIKKYASTASTAAFAGTGNVNSCNHVPPSWPVWWEVRTNTSYHRHHKGRSTNSNSTSDAPPLDTAGGKYDGDEKVEEEDENGAATAQTDINCSNNHSTARTLLRPLPHLVAASTTTICSTANTQATGSTAGSMHSSRRPSSSSSSSSMARRPLSAAPARSTPAATTLSTAPPPGGASTSPPYRSSAAAAVSLVGPPIPLAANPATGTALAACIPATFFLPHEYSMFVEEYKRDLEAYRRALLQTETKKSTATTTRGGGDSAAAAVPAAPLWIVKPTNASQGRGIFIISKLSELNRMLHVSSPSTSGAGGGGYGPMDDFDNEFPDREGGNTHNNNSDDDTYYMRQLQAQRQRLERARQPHIVCRYVPNPLLIGGKKFDLRLYVIVLHFQREQLVAYWHEEGFARFCSDRYLGDGDGENDDESEDNDIHTNNMNNNNNGGGSAPAAVQMGAHLTNVAFQKHAEGYNTTHGGKWALQDLWLFIEGAFGRSAGDAVLADIAFLLAQSLLAAAPKVHNDAHCFELYGYDVLIDDLLRPHLIEVNASPSLTATTDADRRLKQRVLCDTLRLVRPPPPTAPPTAATTSSPSSSSSSPAAAAFARYEQEHRQWSALPPYAEYRKRPDLQRPYTGGFHLLHTTTNTNTNTAAGAR